MMVVRTITRTNILPKGGQALSFALFLLLIIVLAVNNVDNIGKGLKKKREKQPSTTPPAVKQSEDEVAAAMTCPNPFENSAVKQRYPYNREAHEKKIMTVRPESTLVIIGANVGPTRTDGSWKLLAHYPKIQKIMVEPVPTIFEQLVQNVKKSGILNTKLENVAIGDAAGETTMFCYDVAKTNKLGYPPWFSQLCSFDRNRLYKNPYDTAKQITADRLAQSDVANAEEFANKFIRPVPVAKNTVRGLMEKHLQSLAQVTIVQIDTEGFDYHVVKQLPFDDPTFRPCVIAYEDVLLSVKQNTDLMDYIARYGYVVHQREPQNIVFYRVK